MTTTFVNLIFIAIFLKINPSACYVSDRYCYFDCVENGTIYKHSSCIRRGENCGPSDKCIHFIDVTINKDFQKVIEKFHNDIRRNVAQGQVRTFPKATNMLSLEYNQEIDNIAQCWALACQPEPDKCRRTLDLKIGQNFYYSEIPISQKNKWDLIDDVSISILQKWESEKAFLTNEILSSYVKPTDKDYSHFTQMIWHNVRFMGCGRARWNTNIHAYFIFICNYGSTTTMPNTEGEAVYESGETCTNCPNDSQCKEGICERKPKRITIF